MKHSLISVVIVPVLLKVQWLHFASWYLVGDYGAQDTVHDDYCEYCAAGMFGALYDDDDDEAGADHDDMPQADDQAGADDDAAPHHRRGELHQPQTSLQMRLGWQKRKRTRAEAVATGLANQLQASFAKHVNRTIFSHGNPENHQVVLLGDGETLEIPKDKTEADLLTCGSAEIMASLRPPLPKLMALQNALKVLL